METINKERFLRFWKTYFNNAEFPITFYHTDEAGHANLVKPNSVPNCIIAALSKVRKGSSLCFDINSVGCAGGKRYLGFTDKIMPNFEYFLSCGIPNKLEGERYKKTPELVKAVMKQSPAFKAPGRFIVFKRWDMLEKSDKPEVVIFFAVPDVLSGLFTLANFDEAEQNGIFAPFGSGCSTIVQYPYLEKHSEHPRGVIGMFDVSARPFVPKDVLTFSVPINKFLMMVDTMEESFLVTGSWTKIRKRISTG
jgi:uncharacterized protein (DUF169 family)